MLEIVSKRAALRPSDYPGSSLQSETNVSLPVLPPQTTINPLLQYNSNNSNAIQPSPSPAAAAAHRYPPTYTSNRPNIAHHTFASQSHNQEHDVSFDDFLFDGTEHFYLRTNLSLLHDCEMLMDHYEKQFALLPSPTPNTSWPQCNINAHTVLVIIEFFILYIAILCYSYSQMQWFIIICLNLILSGDFIKHESNIFHLWFY